eukprot:gene24925-10576_t
MLAALECFCGPSRVKPEKRAGSGKSVKAVKRLESRESDASYQSSDYASCPVLLDFLIQYGSHATAYSTLQEGLQHFVLPGIGYIAFSMMPYYPSRAVCLSDPVCNPCHWALMVDGFTRTHPDALFVQISFNFAHHLSSSTTGYQINSFGGETELDVASYTYSGHAKRSLRQPIARARKDGVTVSELKRPFRAPELDTLQGLRAVSEDWFKEKSVSARTTWFLNRKPAYEKEAAGARTFVARSKDSAEPIGFTVLDPMHMKGQVHGYYSNITRTTSHAHPGTAGLLVQVALETIRAEGVPILSLGLSPLHGLKEGPSSFRSDADTRKWLEFTYEKCNSFYPYKNLASSKSKYGGGSLEGLTDPQDHPHYPDTSVRWKPVYLAHRMTIPSYDLTRMGLMFGTILGVTHCTVTFAGDVIHHIKSKRRASASDGSTKLAVAGRHSTTNTSADTNATNTSTSTSTKNTGTRNTSSNSSAKNTSCSFPTSTKNTNTSTKNTSTSTSISARKTSCSLSTKSTNTRTMNGSTKNTSTSTNTSSKNSSPSTSTNTNTSTKRSSSCSEAGCDGIGAKPKQSGSCSEAGSDGNGAKPKQSGSCSEAGSDGSGAKPKQSGSCLEAGSDGSGAKPKQSGDDSSKATVGGVVVATAVGADDCGQP